jgi:hypothetical protein
MRRFGLTEEHLIGLRYAVNVGLATTIVWHTLQAVDNSNPVWAIASMLAASDPQPDEARRMFRSRLIQWTLPLALAVTVLISSYLVRVKTMWRQAPITAAVVIASALTSDSSAVGVVQGLRKVAAVVFGCVVGSLVSAAMSKVWLIQPSGEVPRAA